ncbi:hypothetical protein ILUMI_03162 [Ignelater luminosus]|uniref:Retrotransposon gag domain-containing protein n=1 Tax=Ignelater luminosus TaxID=2038154 RepID=A0A8K0GFS6_IGNLU|nr:hypothetical protein ILUMI_03162 [Ignelater luminosus]
MAANEEKIYDAILNEVNEIIVGHADSKTKQNANMEQVDTKWIIEQMFDQQEKHFHVEFKKSIELFYGRETALKAQDWLETLKGVSKLNSWPDKLKLKAARANLVGSARHWFIHNNFQTWNEFEGEFKQTFIGSVSKADLLKIMVQRVQKKNEDVCDYFLEKVRLCKDVRLSFEEIKEQVLEGLWLKDLSVHLLMPAEFNKSESTSNNKQRSEETIRCFNCAGSSHRAWECKRTKRERGSCHECGGMDHRLAQFPRARRQQDRQESQSATTLLVHSPDDEIPPTNITLAA